MLNAAKAVKAVMLYRALKDAVHHIPAWLRGVTFYGANDEWLFLQSDHPRMCEECASYNLNVYFGSSLRREFPYHEIVDENMIYPHVHPNCACTLTRMFPVEI